MPAFWDGGRKMIVRFTPTEAGQWDYRTTSNLPRLTAKRRIQRRVIGFARLHQGRQRPPLGH